MEILFQLIAAFIGTVSFSILFSTPNKYLPQCGLVGALGWGVHLLTLNVTGSSVTAIFAASAILTICSRYLARFYKVTTTLFLISGIFTLVPGAGIYYTAYYTITGLEETALYYGMSSLKRLSPSVLESVWLTLYPRSSSVGNDEAEILLYLIARSLTERARPKGIYCGMPERVLPF